MQQKEELDKILLESAWMLRLANNPDFSRYLETFFPDAELEAIRELPFALRRGKVSPVQETVMDLLGEKAPVSREEQLSFYLQCRSVVHYVKRKMDIFRSDVEQLEDIRKKRNEKHERS